MKKKTFFRLLKKRGEGQHSTVIKELTDADLYKRGLKPDAVSVIFCHKSEVIKGHDPVDQE